MSFEALQLAPPLQRLTYWISERESIRLKKAAGEPPPWSTDPVFQAWRFTNVRRMDDRVSQWLWHNWYLPNFDHPNAVAAAVIARFFNLPDALDGLGPLVYRRGRPDLKRIAARLRKRATSGLNIFNSAYMVRGNDGVDKVDSVLEHTVRPLLDDPPIMCRDFMRRSHAVLRARYGFGSFMAGQVVADLRWAMSGEWKDRRRWAPIGPGSACGMNRLHGRDPKAPLTEIRFLAELRDLVDQLRQRLPQSLTGRLEMMDYQNCLCEFSGYEKVLWGQGRKKQRYPGAG